MNNLIRISFEDCNKIEKIYDNLSENDKKLIKTLTLWKSIQLSKCEIDYGNILFDYEMATCVYNNEPLNFSIDTYNLAKAGDIVYIKEASESLNSEFIGRCFKVYDRIDGKPVLQCIDDSLIPLENYQYLILEPYSLR